MSDYVVIEEDRVKLALYTAGNLILTLVLMFICAEFMNRIFYLGVFLGFCKVYVPLWEKAVCRNASV